MKKSFLKRMCWLLAVAIVLGGCHKGNDSKESAVPEYYISFKANGVQKRYTGQALGSFGYSSQDVLYNGVLQGYSGTVSSDKEHIGIILFDNGAIAAGTTYQDPQKAINNSGAEVPRVLINYLDVDGNGYISMGPMVNKNGQINPFPGSDNIVADAKVSISKLTSSVVEGTFSGTTYLSTDATFKTKIVLTEGKFILKAYKTN